MPFYRSSITRTATALPVAVILTALAMIPHTASAQTATDPAPNVAAETPAAPTAPVPDAPLPGTTATPGTAPEPATTAPAPIPATIPDATPDATSAGAPAPSAPAPTPIQIDTLPHDLSPMGMFRAADIVVKAVMIGLALASVATWTILIVKLFEYGAAMARVGRGARRIEEADSLRAVLPTANGSAPDARMLRAAARELNRSGPELSASGIQDRIGSQLSQIQARAARNMNRGTGVLATIGSVAPFVGLFGTVWGIMNSFISISESNTTNLAVVAPGIAEALLATAIGLVAAIPAVVIYNGFARAVGGYRLRLNEAAAGVERLVSRDLDRKAAGQSV